MTTWIRRFAAWSPADPDDERSILAGYVTAAARLEAELELVGAEPLGPINFQASTNHAVFGDPDLDSPRLALLAEVKGIILRNPNPFPELVLFRWPWRRR